jgi:hypothetical protein
MPSKRGRGRPPKKDSNTDLMAFRIAKSKREKFEKVVSGPKVNSTVPEMLRSLVSEFIDYHEGDEDD